jgi:HAMP domain-containing protein
MDKAPYDTNSGGGMSMHASRVAEHSVLRLVVVIVAALLLMSGAIVYVLSDRIIARFEAIETVAEDKEAAMVGAKNRAANEDRPRLTREEKIQFITIVDFEEKDEQSITEPGLLSAGQLRISCAPSVKFSGVGNEIVWAASVIGGDGEYQFTWSGSDNLSGTGQTIRKIYKSTGLKNASVTATSLGISHNSSVADCVEGVRVQSVEVM